MILTIVALFGTLGILFAGVLAMGKGEIEGARKSNKLMRARVLAQASVIIFAGLWIATS